MKKRGVIWIIYAIYCFTNLKLLSQYITANTLRRWENREKKMDWENGIKEALNILLYEVNHWDCSINTARYMTRKTSKKSNMNNICFCYDLLTWNFFSLCFNKLVETLLRKVPLTVPVKLRSCVWEVPTDPVVLLVLEVDLFTMFFFPIFTLYWSNAMFSWTSEGEFQ